MQAHLANSPMNMQYGNYGPSSGRSRNQSDASVTNSQNTLGTITPFIMPSYQKPGMPPLNTDDQSAASLTDNMDKNGFVLGSPEMRTDIAAYPANVHYNYQASYGNHANQPMSPPDDDGIYGPGDDV